MNPTEIEAGESYRCWDGVIRTVKEIFPFDYGDGETGMMVRYSVDHQGFITMPLAEFAARAKEEVK